MTRSKKLVCVAAVLLCLADTFVLALARGDVVTTIGWGRLAMAFALQLAALAVVAGWSIVQGWIPPKEGDDDASYRSHVPVTFIAVVLVMTVLSLDLLYTGLVCPSVDIPTVRGRPMC